MKPSPFPALRNASADRGRRSPGSARLNRMNSHHTSLKHGTCERPHYDGDYRVVRGCERRTPSARSSSRDRISALLASVDRRGGRRVRDVRIRLGHSARKPGTMPRPDRAGKVRRRHDLAPKHLSNWIRAAKDGCFALPADEMPTFVPVVSVKSAQVNKATHERRPACIEIVMGIIKVRVPGGANPRDVEAVLRAVWRSNA